MAHPLRSGSMAQHEAIAARHRTSPKTPPSPNIEQLVRGGEAMRWSPHASPLVKEQPEMELEHTPQQKKSVLAKVKEKAKKWSRSLSSKKRHNDYAHNNNNNNTTPSWGVSLDDEDEDDPEYLGAPMYESEMAPDGYTKNVAAKQHQPPPARSSSPLVLEKQVLVNANSSSIDNHRNKSPTSKMLIRESVAAGKQPQVSPSPRTLAETLQEKPAPPPLDATRQVIAPKAQNLSISTSSQPQQSSSGTKTEASHQASSSCSSAAVGTSKSAAAPSSAPAAAASVTWKHPPASVPTTMAPKQAAQPGPLKLEKAAPAPVATKPAEVDEEVTYLEPRAHSAPAPGKGAALDTGRTNNDQIWDKGVSVKEYLMNKLEPGEDAKALSQVISQAMSPRKAPGDAGVVEKVKEVVSSLWQQEDSSSSSSSSSQSASQSTSQTQSSTPSRPTRHNPPSSPHIPISTNSTKVEEENQGRILQAN